jgi:hypothetical protein
MTTRSTAVRQRRITNVRVRDRETGRRRGQSWGHIVEERAGVQIWLERVLGRLEDGLPTTALAEEAVDSDDILYSPDVIKRRCRKKKTRPKSMRS